MGCVYSIVFIRMDNFFTLRTVEEFPRNLINRITARRRFWRTPREFKRRLILYFSIGYYLTGPVLYTYCVQRRRP